jgi:muramoyltetrapeptide carboxypeptidase
MVIPPFLKKGDKIGIVSTASVIDRKVVEPAIDLLFSLGFDVLIGKHTFSAFHQFSSTDSERASDLQAMLDNPEIKAIICSRGGYGTLRTLELIDFSHFIQNPKWITGFSDVTVLHSKLHNLGIASIHGVMPRYFFQDEKISPSFKTLSDAIAGHPLSYEIQSDVNNRIGKATGMLVGGNLSILYSLRGTPYDIDTAGKILFIEDLGEHLYHLDRMMMNLKTGGKLEQLAGILVGNFSGMKDLEEPYGMSVEEIIFDAVKEYGFPVAFQFPGGHARDNFALKLGIETNLEVTGPGICQLKPTHWEKKAKTLPVSTCSKKGVRLKSETGGIKMLKSISLPSTERNWSLLKLKPVVQQFTRSPAIQSHPKKFGSL